MQWYNTAIYSLFSKPLTQGLPEGEFISTSSREIPLDELLHKSILLELSRYEVTQFNKRLHGVKVPLLFGKILLPDVFASWLEWAILPIHLSMSFMAQHTASVRPSQWPLFHSEDYIICLQSCETVPYPWPSLLAFSNLATSCSSWDADSV